MWKLLSFKQNTALNKDYITLKYVIYLSTLLLKMIIIRVNVTKISMILCIAKYSLMYQIFFTIVAQSKFFLEEHMALKKMKREEQAYGSHRELQPMLRHPRLLAAL